MLLNFGFLSWTLFCACSGKGNLVFAKTRTKALYATPLQLFWYAFAPLAPTPVIRSLSQSVTLVSTVSVSVDRHKASVNPETSYIFRKLWTTAFKFLLGGQKKSLCSQKCILLRIDQFSKKIDKSILGPNFFDPKLTHILSFAGLVTQPPHAPKTISLNEYVSCLILFPRQMHLHSP